MGSLEKVEVQAMTDIISLKVEGVEVANKDLWDTIGRLMQTAPVEDVQAAIKNVNKKCRTTIVIYPSIPDNSSQAH